MLDGFRSRARERLPRKRKKGYPNIKAYILGEKRDEIKGDYEAYLKGKYFPKELAFFDQTGLKRLFQDKAYEAFIESIAPYGAIKYVFRRGVLPLLHILHPGAQRTDMGLLGREYRQILPAVDFMLKAFNVRKTLFIMGQWDLAYFLYIMNARNAREFCRTYLKHQKAIVQFVRRLIRRQNGR